MITVNDKGNMKKIKSSYETEKLRNGKIKEKSKILLGNKMAPGANRPNFCLQIFWFSWNFAK